MDRMDIYIGDIYDSEAIYEIAAMCGCVVLENDGKFASVEGSPKDLDDFIERISIENLFD